MTRGGDLTSTLTGSCLHRLTFPGSRTGAEAGTGITEAEEG